MMFQFQSLIDFQSVVLFISNCTGKNQFEKFWQPIKVKGAKNREHKMKFLVHFTTLDIDNSYNRRLFLFQFTFLLLLRKTISSCPVLLCIFFSLWDLHKSTLVLITNSRKKSKEIYFVNGSFSFHVIFYFHFIVKSKWFYTLNLLKASGSKS